MKVLQVGNKSFHENGWTDEQTDRYDELIVAFRSFAKSLKDESRNI